MIIDTKITIAYKCPACGSFDFFHIYLFNLINKKKNIFNCKCNESHLEISKIVPRKYKLDIPCIACGDVHEHNIKMKDILNGVTVLCCNHMDIKQCVIGEDINVRKKVDELEREFDDIIDMFGYDNYFSNAHVMMEMVNIVHDYAENGNLFCSCGSSSIELSLLADSINLECSCGKTKNIKAVSNEDIKNIISEGFIMLGEFNSRKGNSLKTKNKKRTERRTKL